MFSLTHPAPRRKPALPVSGGVEWIKRPTGPTLSGRFAITGVTRLGPVVTAYDVAALPDGAGRVTGFGLAKDDDEVHAVDFSKWYGPTCTCGDYEYRRLNSSMHWRKCV